MLKQRIENISDLLGKSTPKAKPEDLFSEKGEADLYTAYRSSVPDGLPYPHAIIAGDDLNIIFSKVGAYHSDASPLSSFSHILERSFADLVGMKRRSPQELPDRFYLSCIGAAIGETLATGAPSSKEPSSVATYSATSRSLSIALARARSIYGSQSESLDIAQRWTRVRAISGLGARPEIVDAAMIVGKVASGCGSMADLLPADLTEALRHFSVGGSSARVSTASAFNNLYNGFEAILATYSGAFDGRITAFSKIVELVLKNSRGARVDSIAIAFACDAVSPGSFSHSRVLLELIELVPAALPWYGFFAGSQQGGLQQFHYSGLFHKLERDVRTPFSFEERPRCDISLEELETLRQADLPPSVLRPVMDRMVLVSIFPGVNMFARTGIDGRSEIEQSHTISPEMLARTRNHLMAALDVLNSADRRSKSGPRRPSR